MLKYMKSKKGTACFDDEFAKDVSEFSSLEEYKADLKRKLVESAEQNARSQMENQLLSNNRNATVDIRTL